MSEQNKTRRSESRLDSEQRILQFAFMQVIEKLEQRIEKIEAQLGLSSQSGQQQAKEANEKNLSTQSNKPSS